MSQKNQHLATQRKYSLRPGEIVIVLGCLALPAVFYLVTGHPAFLVVFLSGMIGISVYIGRASSG